jgi:hypothetical protein
MLGRARTRGLVALLAGLLATSASAQLVTSFENPGEFGRPLVSISTGVVVTPHTGTGVTDGAQAMAIDFPPASAGVSLAVQMNLTTPVGALGTVGFVVDVYNPTTRPLGLGLMIRDLELDAASDYIQIEPGQSVSIILRLDTWNVDVLGTYGMERLPSPYPGMVALAPKTNLAVDLSNISKFTFFMRGGRMTTDRLIVDNVRLLPMVFPHHILTNMTDAFGQYTRLVWPGKVYSTSELDTRRATEEAAWAANPSLPDRNSFGGMAASPNYGKTGFFYTKKIAGKWWLIDPHGRKFFSTGISRLRPEASDTLITTRESMFTYLPDSSSAYAKHFTYYPDGIIAPITSGWTFSFYKMNQERKYGGLWQTRDQTTLYSRMKHWGFNTLGRGTTTIYYKNNRVCYIGQGVIEGTYKIVSVNPAEPPTPDPYDPNFRLAVRDGLQRVYNKTGYDNMMIGTVVGVEPIFRGREVGTEYQLATQVLKLRASTSPAKAEFVRQLQAKYGTIEALNLAWGTAYASWTTVENPLTMPATPPVDLSVDYGNFVREYVSTFHRIASEESKARFPNHLFLGCSLNLWSPEIIAGSAPWVDVQTFNYYRPDIEVENAFSFMPTYDKPALITEFHFGATDGGGIHPGIQQVANQEARGNAFLRYLNSCLDNPYFVGCLWYQYIDNPITGWEGSGINYAAGYVDITDTPHPELVSATRYGNSQVYLRR